MSTFPVFEKTVVTLSDSFIQKMPETLDFKQVFEESCAGLKCITNQEGDQVTYALEGLWEAVVDAQKILMTHLLMWDALKTNSSDKDGPLVSKNTCHIVKLTEASAPDLNKGNVICAEEEVEISVKAFHQKPSSNESAQLVMSKPLILKTSEEALNKSVSSIQECIILGESMNEESRITETPTDNEIFMDIQLEHNYNHFKSAETSQTCTNSDKPSIENEIYMDIKLSQPNNEIFSDPDLPVTLVVAKEDDLGVEVLQLNRNKTDLPSQSSNQNRERLKLLRKKYEQQAPFRYFCNQCSFKTKRHSHMKTHSRLHEKVCTIYSCDQCDFSTIRASHLKRHIVSHEKEVFSCPDCQYITHEKKLFNKHQRYKHIVSKKSVKSGRKNTYQCLHCNYTTTSEKTFQRHMTVHAQKKGRDKPSCFKCNHCSYQTPSRSNYSRHLSGHAGERPFMCTTCGLCFKRSDTLVQHQATHITKEGKEGAFTCPQCQKCFRSNTVLKEHMLTHGDEQRYLCEICAASFKTRDNQRRHYNQKHVHDKENICPTCSKTFSSRYILKRHMKLHDQKKPTTNISDAQKKTISDVPQAITNQSPKEWCNLQTASDSVQVIVVHQESSQSELTVQEGPLFQVASSLIPGQTLSVPVIPIEYVIPTSEAEVNTNNGGPAISVTPSSKEEIIALTFVQEDSEFIGHNQTST